MRKKDKEFEKTYKEYKKLLNTTELPVQEILTQLNISSDTSALARKLRKKYFRDTGVSLNHRREMKRKGEWL